MRMLLSCLKRLEGRGGQSERHVWRRRGATCAVGGRLRSGFRLVAKLDLRRSESGKARYAYRRQSACEDPMHKLITPPTIVQRKPSGAAEERRGCPETRHSPVGTRS